MSDVGKSLPVWPRHIAHWFACGFGAGLAPFAPGTFGTLMAVPVYWLMQPLAAPWYGVMVVIVCAIGIAVSTKTARDWGVHDHPAIVCDEIAGFLVTMFMAPAGWIYVLYGFALFRLFDIAKPFPLRRLERLPGGWGIMADDLGAGVYAAAILHATVWLM